MSQLIAPTHTLADSIPLGRRIAEIMQEKGSAYTIAAMSKRLGINRETLRLMLRGEREIYTFELEKIAHDLKLSVERILQADIVEEYKQLEELNVTRADIQHGFKLAQSLLQCSIGITERSIAVNHLGASYYIQGKYLVAQELFEKSLELGKLILKKWREPKQVVLASLNLVNCMVSQKKFIGLRQIIEEAEPYVIRETNLRAPAVLYALDAIIKEEWEGDRTGARKSLYKSIDFYQQVGHPFSLARSQYRLAVFEYRQQNYDTSYDFFQIALSTFQKLEDHYHFVVNGRDLGKLLIRMGDLPQAVEVLSKCLDTFHSYPDIEWLYVESDLYLLAAIAEQNPKFAHNIIDRELGSISTQKLAGKFLIEYYERIGDDAMVTICAQQQTMLRASPIDMLLSIQKQSTETLLTLVDFVQLHGWNAVDSFHRSKENA